MSTVEPSPQTVQLVEVAKVKIQIKMTKKTLDLHGSRTWDRVAVELIWSALEGGGVGCGCTDGIRSQRCWISPIPKNPKLLTSLKGTLSSKSEAAGRMQ